MESKDGSGAAFPLKNELMGSGLTKREWFAGMVIQGMFANPEVVNEHGLFNQSNFKIAFECADKMLEGGK